MKDYRDLYTYCTDNTESVFVNLSDSIICSTEKPNIISSESILEIIPDYDNNNDQEIE